MRHNLPYPKSFPTADEELFLKLVLCEDADFTPLWNQWKTTVVFDEIDQSILKLLPLLYLRLKKLGIRDDLTGRIKGVYRMVWVKNQILVETTATIIAILEKNHIPTMVLKGIPLLTEIYKNLGARFTGDGDLLIDPHHIKKAVDIILAHGWKLEHLPFPPSEKSTIDSLIAIDMEVTFAMINMQENRVDIHWKLFNDPVRFFSKTKEHPTSYQALATCAVPISIHGVPCTMPCSEDLLIHVIVHGSEHNFQRPIRWVVDAIYIIKNSALDWDRLLTRITMFNFRLEMYLACIYLRERHGITIPDSFMNSLSNTPFTKKALRAYYRFTNKPHSSWLGNFPLLLKIYWKYESGGFIDYLRRAYHLERKRQLPGFIIGKYKDRILGRLL